VKLACRTHSTENNTFLANHYDTSLSLNTTGPVRSRKALLFQNEQREKYRTSYIAAICTSDIRPLNTSLAGRKNTLSRLK
jgi:hypothetical protein